MARPTAVRSAAHGNVRGAARRTASRLLLAAGAALLAVGVLPAVATAAPPPIPTSVQPLLSGDLTSYEWMLGAVNAPQAWTKSTGTGVTVAVLDTGVDSTQPDLAGQVVPGGVVRRGLDGSWSVTDAPLKATNRDTIGHGSHVAGIIAANDDGQGITGIAPGAHIMPVAWPASMLDQMDLVDFYDSLGAAVTYAADRGVQVVNISLGGSLDDIANTKHTAFAFKAEARACQAVTDAEAAGVFVSVAAGNDGFGLNEQSTPAACDGAFSVAAVGPDLRRSFFSSYDPTVQIAAPGYQVLSVASGPSGMRGGHVEESGTSMASPVVAGAAALVRSLHPAWTPAQVADDLTTTAQDLGPTGQDPETGFGLVDAAAAVGAAAPPAHPVDHVSALAVQDLVLDRKPGPQPSVISWNMPGIHVATGYTVTVYDSSGSQATDVDGLQVRLRTSLAADAWVQVVAHTTAGDVAAFPVPLVNPWDFGGDGPAPARHITANRHGRALVVHWTLPKGSAGTIDRISIYAFFSSPAQRVQRTIKVAKDAAVPRRAVMRLPRALSGHDCLGIGILTVQRFPGGWSATGNMRRALFPAVDGLAVDRLVPAGRHGAEVSGSMAPSMARKVCGGHSCAGRQVQVVVRYGTAQSVVTARLTNYGLFHADLWRPAGAMRMNVQVRGPGATTSGGFWRYGVA